MLGSGKSNFGRAAAFAMIGAAIASAGFLARAPGAAGGVPAASGSDASAAFSVRASNGFSLDVLSLRGAVTIVASERRPPVATFSQGGAPRPASNANGAASIYRVRAAGVDPREVDVRLGQLGRIAVSFHPDGRSRVTTLGSNRCGAPTRIVRRLGTFRGSVEFRGEDGYTSVRTTSARGSVGTPLPTGCASAARVLSRPGESGAPRRAVLSVANRRAGTRFEARSTGSGVAFTATWRDRLADGVVVSRRAYAGAPRGSFSFGRHLTWARVSPPAPFSGAASLAPGEGGGSEWKGRLTATFPGGVVPLTGPGFRAQLREPR